MATITIIDTKSHLWGVNLGRLGKRELILGGEQECDIVILGGIVSKRHGIFRLQGHQLIYIGNPKRPDQMILLLYRVSADEEIGGNRNNMEIGKWKRLDEVWIPPIDYDGFLGNVIIRDPIPPIEDMPHGSDSVSSIERASAQSSEDTLLLWENNVDAGEQPTEILSDQSIAAVKRVNTGETAIISGDYLVIGKSRKADFIITNNETISRQHAAISRMEDGYYLSDLESTNSTYINGSRITQPVKLENGTVFQLSRETFEFMLNYGD